MGSEDGGDAIAKFANGLVLSIAVGLGLRGLAYLLNRQKKNYGFVVDCILFDQKIADAPVKDDTKSTTQGAKKSMFKCVSDNPTIQRGIHLACCAIGLIVAFLIYGVQQERIMTSDYDGKPFKNPNFLIFCNRFMAFMIAFSVCYATNTLRPKCGLYKFSYCSISNIMSSFCQFASLQFLSFPVLQVAKSCKTLAVLVVQYLVLGRISDMFEYIVAFIVMLGAGFFFYIFAETTKGGGESSSWSMGIIFLLFFIFLDGFTNVWQGHLNSKYATSQWQMMLGVNFFSMTLTLLIQGSDNTLMSTLARMLSTPSLAFDTATLCLSAVCGQLFIFHTIKEFGPLVFTLISICRVILSIIVSCLLYDHHIVPTGWMSIGVVFGAMGYRAYKKSMKRRSSGRVKVVSETGTDINNTAKHSGGKSLANLNNA